MLICLQIPIQKKPIYAEQEVKIMNKIQEDISESVTLVQLMDSLGNVNYAISVVGYWIFDSNYQKSLVLNMASLDMIFPPYVGEGKAAEFELVFTAVR